MNREAVLSIYCKIKIETELVMRNFRKAILFISMLIGGLGVVIAQDYYDDDIYYDASKEKKVEKKQQVKKM